jgi:ferric-dicitrate binding protein FerR (iron transport regulator)
LLNVPLQLACRLPSEGKIMEDKQQPPKRRRIFRGLILFVLLLLIVGLGASLALGWISFHQSAGTFTIVIRTHKATQETGQAIKKTKDVTVETGKALQRAGKQLAALGDDDDAAAPESQVTNEPAAESHDASESKGTSSLQEEDKAPPQGTRDD